MCCIIIATNRKEKGGMTKQHTAKEVYITNKKEEKF